MNEPRFTDADQRTLEGGLARVAAQVNARPDWPDVERRARRSGLSRYLIGAAAVTLVAVGALAVRAWSDSGDSIPVVAGPGPSSTVAADDDDEATAADTPRPSTLLVYTLAPVSPDRDKAIVEVDSSTGEAGSVVSTLLGEEMSTRIAYDTERATVYYSRTITGCTSDLLRVASGDDPILVGLGHAPAVDSVGGRLAFARPVGTVEPSGDPSGGCPADEIVIRDLSGLETDLTVAPSTRTGLRVTSLDWSTDGARLVIEAIDDSGNQQMYLVDPSADSSLDDAERVEVPDGTSWASPRFRDADTFIAAELIGWNGLFAERSQVAIINAHTGQVGPALLEVPGTVTDLSVDDSGDHIAAVVATEAGNRTSYELFVWHDGTLSSLVAEGATSATWIN